MGSIEPPRVVLHAQIWCVPAVAQQPFGGMDMLPGGPFMQPAMGVYQGMHMPPPPQLQQQHSQEGIPGGEPFQGQGRGRGSPEGFGRGRGRGRMVNAHRQPLADPLVLERRRKNREARLKDQVGLRFCTARPDIVKRL